MTRAAVPLLLALAVALGAVLYLEQRAGVPGREQARTEPEIGIVRPTLETPAPDRAAAWTATILDRPLFSPSRRPPQAAPQGKAAGPALPRLTGVLVSASGADAIFATPGKKPILARPGDRVGPYLVRSIRAGEVTVLGPSGVAVLHPTFASEGTGMAPSQPVAAAAPPPVQPAEKKAALGRSLPTREFIENIFREQKRTAK